MLKFGNEPSFIVAWMNVSISIESSTKVKIAASEIIGPIYSVAKTFELQGAANSSPTRKHCSEGAQFLKVLKSAQKSKFGRYLGIFQ